MAFILGAPNFNTPMFPNPEPPAVCREGNGTTVGPTSAGSVIVFEDRFDCQFGQENHGSLVTRSVRQTGFQGQIQRQQLNHGFPKDGGIFEPGLPPAEARKRLDQASSRMVVDTLQSYTEALNNQSRAGVKNSVVNISGGLNKADVLRDLMGKFSENPVARDNAMRALGVDPQKLGSCDQQVAEAEHRKFQQGVVDSINRGLDGNADVKKARGNYDTAVRRFESNHNSVVVAVGNTGGAEHQVRPGVQLPPDFQKSFNINDQVTPVGASQVGLGRTGYTSNERANAIYTDGQAPRDNVLCGRQGLDGTSFAAPRVSALLAEIHKRFPKLTSQQAENLLRQQLTDESRGYTEIDPQKSQRFLAEG